MLIKGNIEFIDKNLFENFNEITYIEIKSDSLMNFFHCGTKWINSLNNEECSCTLIWLVQNYNLYFSDDFKIFVNLVSDYMDYFENVTVSDCVRNKDYLNE